MFLPFPAVGNFQKEHSLELWKVFPKLSKFNQYKLLRWVRIFEHFHIHYFPKHLYMNCFWHWDSAGFKLWCNWKNTVVWIFSEISLKHQRLSRATIINLLIIFQSYTGLSQGHSFKAIIRTVGSLCGHTPLASQINDHFPNHQNNTRPYPEIRCSEANMFDSPLESSQCVNPARVREDWWLFEPIKGQYHKVLVPCVCVCPTEPFRSPSG